MDERQQSVLQLLDEHGSSLYGHVARLTRCAHATRDLMQDLFVKLQTVERFEKIQDLYAQNQGLVGMEVTRQSRGGVLLPKRLRLYVDPNRDYLTHRYISEEVFDAPWQADKDWLDSVENKDHLRAEVRDHQVTEYGRASQGQWYPKEITIQGYDQRYDSTREPYSRIVRIHLVEEFPEFSEALFDPNALPKASSENPLP